MQKTLTSQAELIKTLTKQVDHLTTLAGKGPMQGVTQENLLDPGKSSRC
jgi:hypothetical protein